MIANEITRRSARSMLLLGIVVGIMSIGRADAANGDPAAGALKAEVCAGCHGIAGWRNAYPAYRVPKLGGQNAEYLASALKAYQTGQRAHPTMQAIAATLTEQDIADLVAYLSAPERPQ